MTQHDNTGYPLYGTLMVDGDMCSKGVHRQGCSNVTTLATIALLPGALLCVAACVIGADGTPSSGPSRGQAPAQDAAPRMRGPEPGELEGIRSRIMVSGSRIARRGAVPSAVGFSQELQSPAKGVNTVIEGGREIVGGREYQNMTQSVIGLPSTGDTIRFAQYLFGSVDDERRQMVIVCKCHVPAELVVTALDDTIRVTLDGEAIEARSTTMRPGLHAVSVTVVEADEVAEEKNAVSSE